MHIKTWEYELRYNYGNKSNESMSVKFRKVTHTYTHTHRVLLLRFFICFHVAKQVFCFLW